VKGKTTAWCLY